MGVLLLVGFFGWGLYVDVVYGMVFNNYIYVGDCINNFIKVNSVKFGGFSFGVMFGFGEVVGNNNVGCIVSVIGQYDSGVFSGVFVYIDIKSSSGVFVICIYGGGVCYQIGVFIFFGVIIQVKNIDINVKVIIYELGMVYVLMLLWDLVVVY